MKEKYVSLSVFFISSRINKAIDWILNHVNTKQNKFKWFGFKSFQTHDVDNYQRNHGQAMATAYQQQNSSSFQLTGNKTVF